QLNDLIGRTELLDMKSGIEHWKAKGLDFTKVFTMPRMPAEVARFHRESQQHGLEKALDNRIIELAQPALERREKVTIEMPIGNINRTVGTMLAGQIAKRYGHEGARDGMIHVRLAGSAGESFGAFLARGVSLDVVGQSDQQAQLPQHLWAHGRSAESVAKAVIEKRVRHPGSKRAAGILAKWGDSRSRFVKVFPKEYRRALGELAAAHKRAAA